MTNIVQKIKQLQYERNWTDYRLSQEADISQSSLATLFARQTPPKLEMLQSICGAFGITLAQFFWEREKTEVLNEREKELVSGFRRLSRQKQDGLIALLTE